MNSIKNYCMVEYKINNDWISQVDEWKFDNQIIARKCHQVIWPIVSFTILNYNLSHNMSSEKHRKQN